MQYEYQAPRAIDVAKVRTYAWNLLAKIETTKDEGERRELARRAFRLAQIAEQFADDGPVKRPANSEESH
jgi:hypothetical protein